MAATLSELAYESALRSLDKQERLVDEVRSRTGVLLGVSSLAASFVGRTALAADPVVPAIIALVAFGISIGASLYILLPKKNLVFSLVGSEVYEQLYEFEEDISEVFRRLAYDLDRFWDLNDRLITRLLWGFRLATGALAVEIILLLVAVSGTLL